MTTTTAQPLARPTALKDFGFLAVTGRDANKFLQGYTTCDLNDVTEAVSLPGAICNIQGRMVSNFHAIQIEGGYLLRLHRELVAPTLAFLQKYIVFSKAEMTDLSATWKCYGITGAIDNLSTQVHATSHTADGILVRVSKHRAELWTDQANLEADTEDSAWLRADINDGIVWLEAATSEAFIPQMINLASRGGISFQKGCYLGQEIVARMQYRGELKRRLHRGTATTVVAAGDTLIKDGGKVAGTIVSAHQQDFLAVIQNTDPAPLDLALATGEAVSVSLIQTPPRSGSE